VANGSICMEKRGKSLDAYPSSDIRGNAIRQDKEGGLLSYAKRGEERRRKGALESHKRA